MDDELTMSELPVRAETKMSIATVFAILFLVKCSSLFGQEAVSAQMGNATVRDYERARQFPIFKSYISGVGGGFAWANRRLAANGKPMIYCAPNEVILEAKYLQILDSAVGRLDVTTSGDVRVEDLLLQSLISKFPCPSESAEAATTGTPSHVRTLKFDPAILQYSGETHGACIGILTLGTRLQWEDVKNCWGGPDIDADLRDVEYIDYEIWDFGGANVIVKLKSIKRVFFGLGPPLGNSLIPAEKIFRHFRNYSHSTIQRCFDASTHTPIRCDTWVTD